MQTATASVTDIASACLAGTLSGAEVRSLARDFWERGDFVHYVDPGELASVVPKGSPTNRYAGAETVLHWRLYGETGKPGCIMVRCPHDAEYDGDLGNLQVPPHVHTTDHIAIVLKGGGNFIAARSVDGQKRIVSAPARPGMVGFYPSGVAHTFIVGSEGIFVASVQHEYQSPESKEFATLVRGSLMGLEQVRFGAD